MQTTIFVWMQYANVQNFLYYAGIVLVVAMASYIILHMNNLEVLATRVAVIGTILAFLFGVTGLVLKKLADRDQKLPWKKP